MTYKIPKLLAPAGSMEALHAAVAAGADEIYISGKMYGARHYAPNFSKTEIREALEYAHLRGLKVYVTVNTLLKDGELLKVANYLTWLYQIGVDGVIIQDPGVAHLAKELVPQLPLHASTQMTIYNREGIEYAADLGFERVILAREMSLSDIRKVPDSLLKRIELEIFAHGALCYSYSGLCLFSSLVGGRSGNRGMCAQPCRKLYEMMSGKKDKYGRPLQLDRMHHKESYLLSTKDLALYPYLNLIRETDLSALKIEGRMRSAEYVGVVVDIYRRALDSIQKEKWNPPAKEINNLELAFNRGFTSGYVMDDKNNMNRFRPRNRGLYLGKITSIDKKSHRATMKIESDIIPEKGDGLLFISPQQHKKESGTRIHSINQVTKDQYLLKVPYGIEKGFKVYMTRKDSLIKKSKELIRNASEQSHISLDINLNWDQDLVPHIRGRASNKAGEVLIDYKASNPMEMAKKQAITEDQIKKQLIKTGGTPFHINHVKIDYPGGLFAPISAINKIRRDFLEETRTEIVNLSKPSTENIKNVKNRLKKIRDSLSRETLPSANIKPYLSVWVDNLDSLKIAGQSNCKKIVYQPQPTIRLTKDNSDRFFEEILDLLSKAKDEIEKPETELIWKWPLITSRIFIDSASTIMDTLIELQINRIMLDNYGGIMALKKYNPHLKLFGSTGLNIWNHLSISALKNTFHSIILSPELNQNDITTLVSKNRHNPDAPHIEMLVQGNQELIISEDKWKVGSFNINEYSQDIYFGIKDSKKHIFPLKFDYEGRTIISNSKELCLIDYIPQIREVGCEGLVIDTRTKTPLYTEKILSSYVEALEESIKNPNNLNKLLKELKDEIKKVSSGGITTGNFKRGIMV